MNPTVAHAGPTLRQPPDSRFFRRTISDLVHIKLVSAPPSSGAVTADDQLEGETWSRDQLVMLRVARWRPRAWWRLLRASFERAGSVRRQRPALARQADVWALAATCGAVTAAAGGTRRAPAAVLGWSLACWAMLRWHLGMVDRRGLGAGDALTLGRLWGSPLALVVRRERFVGVVAAAALSDMLDGPLARRDGSTRLGRDVDSAADLAVLVSACARRDLLPAAARVALAVRVLAPALVTTRQYFGEAQRPSWAQTHASRHAATPTLLGFAAAARGARRTGGALVVAGSALALRALRHSTRESYVRVASSDVAAPPIATPGPRHE